jgi:hypothetical protein
MTPEKGRMQQEWLNRIEKEVIAQALSGGLDMEVGAQTQLSMQEALKLMVDRLAKDMKSGAGHCKACGRHAPAGRDVAALVKAVDDYTRLLKFVQGEPDRIVGVSADDHSVLRWLTDDELDELMAKVQNRKMLAATGQPDEG